MPRVFYVGGFRFPDGDAAAARVLGIGKALRAAGYDVTFAGWEQHPREGDKTVAGSYAFDGFPYVSQNEFRQSNLAPVARLIRYMSSGSTTLRWLQAQGLHPGDVVVAYGGHSVFVSRLSSLCRARGVHLICDCTEWYEPSHLVGGKWGLVRWDEEFRMRVVHPRVGRMIVISSYLEKFYRASGTGVICVPPLVDMADPKWPTAVRAERTGPLRLGYAGVPGKKDLLASVLRALVLLRAQAVRVDLDLFGPSRDAVATCLNGETSVLDELGDAVQFHGRIPQDQVPTRLGGVDFTVILRPTARYSEAGFPTKLVESLASGVPVITTPTSDIATFVKHGKEGILLDGHSPAAVARGIQEILRMPRKAWLRMGAAGRARALDAFDYHSYVDILGRFLSEGRRTSNSLGAARLAD